MDLLAYLGTRIDSSRILVVLAFRPTDLALTTIHSGRFGWSYKGVGGVSKLR